MKGRIQERWETYRDRILVPAGAGGIQQRECRRAFFGGAASLFDVLMVGLDPGSEPTAEDLRKMEEINAELIQFARDVKENRA